MLQSAFVSLLAVVSMCCAGPIVQPLFQQLRSPGKASVSCVFPQPLTECRIRLSDHYYNYFDTVLDFSKGNGSSEVKFYSGGNTRSTAKYFGAGLQAGHCGVELRVQQGAWSLIPFIECLAKEKDRGWSRGHALMTSDSRTIAVCNTTTPRLVEATAGTDLTVHLTVQGSLGTCFINTPSSGEVNVYGSSPARNIVPFGSGHVLGGCGAKVPKVEPKDGGVWSWWGHRASPDGIAFQSTMVLVKETPIGNPELKISSTVYRIGQVMNATCRSPPGVPAPKLTWLLGGKVVRQDDLNNTLAADVGVTHPWEPQSAVQTFHRLVVADDDKKRLECRLDHPGLSGPKSAGVDVKLMFCGMRGLGNRIRIAGGEDADEGEFPWHVGVYSLSARDGSLSQICGGTLVASEFVVTAAHCFYDNQLNKVRPHTMYKVAAGKYLRDWTQLEPGTQRSDIAKINLPPRYRGRRSNLQYDIAVVKLANAVSPTEFVQPICMDWTHQYETEQSATGTVGTVTGWGKRLDDSFGEILQKIDLPIVNFTECFNALADEVKILHTDDKFCAGFANMNRSVCSGDSGGGLTFPTDDRYFLRGVVSAAFSPSAHATECYAQNYVGFTNVSHHLAWIKTIVHP